jgi:hypothetical protein
MNDDVIGESYWRISHDRHMNEKYFHSPNSMLISLGQVPTEARSLCCVKGGIKAKSDSGKVFTSRLNLAIFLNFVQHTTVRKLLRVNF